MNRPAVAFVALILVTPAHAQGSPQWEYREHVDPFSDAKTHTMLRLSDDLSAALTFSCEGAQSIKLGASWFDVPRYVGANEVQMDWRIGDNPPKVIAATNLDLRQAKAGFKVIASTDIESLAEELSAGEALGVDVKFRADNKMSTVRLDGFSQQWTHLKAACGK